LKKKASQKNLYGVVGVLYELGETRDFGSHRQATADCVEERHLSFFMGFFWELSRPVIFYGICLGIVANCFMGFFFFWELSRFCQIF